MDIDFEPLADADPRVPPLPAGDGSAPTVANLLPGRGVVTARTTTYFPGERYSDPDTDAGRTATGGPLVPASPDMAGTVAVDPKKYPYGTIFRRPDGSVYVAADTGGAVKSMRASRGVADVLDFASPTPLPDWESVQVIPPQGNYLRMSATEKATYHRQAAAFGTPAPATNPTGGINFEPLPVAGGTPAINFDPSPTADPTASGPLVSVPDTRPAAAPVAAPAPVAPATLGDKFKDFDNRVTAGVLNTIPNLTAAAGRAVAEAVDPNTPEILTAEQKEKERETLINELADIRDVDAHGDGPPAPPTAREQAIIARINALPGVRENPLTDAEKTAAANRRTNAATIRETADQVAGLKDTVREERGVRPELDQTTAARVAEAIGTIPGALMPGGFGIASMLANTRNEAEERARKEALDRGATPEEAARAGAAAADTASAHFAATLPAYMAAGKVMGTAAKAITPDKAGAIRTFLTQATAATAGNVAASAGVRAASGEDPTPTIEGVLGADLPFALTHARGEVAGQQGRRAMAMMREEAGRTPTVREESAPAPVPTDSAPAGSKSVDEPAPPRERVEPTFAPSADAFLDGEGSALRVAKGELPPPELAETPHVETADGGRVYFDPGTHTPEDFAPRPATPDSDFAPKDETKGPVRETKPPVSETKPPEPATADGLDADALEEAYGKLIAGGMSEEEASRRLSAVSTARDAEDAVAQVRTSLDEEATARRQLEQEQQADADGYLKNESGGTELLDAIADAGGLPTVGHPGEAQFRGELANVRSAARGSRNFGGQGGVFTGRLFRKDAPGMDELVQRLRARGFDFTREDDLFQAVEQRLRTGKAHFGFAEGNPDIAPRAKVATTDQRLNAAMTVRQTLAESPDAPRDQSVVKVATSEADLPEHVRNHPLASRAEAFWDPQSDTVHVLPWNVTDPARAHQVLRHELLHRGLKLKYGRDYNAILDGAAARASEAELEDVARDYSETLPPNWRDDPAARRYVAEEVLARRVEAGNARQGWTGRAVSAVRDLLRRTGAVRTVTENDLAGVLRRSVRAGVLGERQPMGAGSPLAARRGQTLREADRDNFPVDNATPRLLDRSGRAEDMARHAAAEVQSWPATVRAPDGSTIRLQNPEAGSLGSRVFHMLRDEESGRILPSKAAWLPAVPDTLRNAAARVVDERTGNRLYVREYLGHGKHLVVVRPDGQVLDQRPLTGRLITQFPSEPGGRQGFMRIDWIRGEEGHSVRQSTAAPAPSGSSETAPSRPGQDNPTERGTPGQPPRASVRRRSNNPEQGGLFESPEDRSRREDKLARIARSLRPEPAFDLGDEQRPAPKDAPPEFRGADRREESPDLGLRAEERGGQQALFSVRQNAQAVREGIAARKAKDEIAAGKDAGETRAGMIGRQAADSVKLDFGSQKELAKKDSQASRDLAAMPFIIEAGGDRTKLAAELARVRNSSDPALAKEFAPRVQHAIDHFDRLDGLKGNAESIYAKQRAIERRHGIDTPEVQNYVNRRLELPESRQRLEPAQLFGSPGGGGGGRYFVKGRKFATIGEAIEAGYRPKSTNLADLIHNRVETGQRIVQRKRLFNQIKTLPASASDPRPIIGALIARKTLSGKTEMDTPPGYTAVQAGGPLIVHKTFAPVFKALYGDSVIRNSSFGRFALKWTGIAKHGTLVMDTFHAFRVASKQLFYGYNVGYGKGLSVLEYADKDLSRAVAAGDLTPAQAAYARRNRPMVDELVKAGLNVGKVSDNLNEEAKSFIEHIPVAGKGIEKFNSWLFTKLQRGATVQTAVKNFERNLSRFPELSRADVARRTAKEMNEVFGNLGSQGVLKSKSLQDTARALFLAPQWMESQAVAEGRGIGQIARVPYDLVRNRRLRLGVVAQGQISSVLALLAAGQVANYLFTGHSTFDNEEGHKFDVWIPNWGKGRGFWFNPMEMAAEYTHMAMRYHAKGEEGPDIVTHILNNKLSPLARGVKDVLSARDYQGTPYASMRERLTAGAGDALPFPMPLGALVEKDPRGVAGALPFPSGPVRDLHSAMDLLRSGSDKALSPFGYRVNRQPGAGERQLLQSAGLKTAYEDSPGQKVRKLADNFVTHRGFQSGSPPVYKELRRALESGDEVGVADELLTLKDSHDGDAIRKAVGIVNKKPESGGAVALGGRWIKPQRFTDNAEHEAAFLKTLTPAQKAIYQDAQKEHVASAMKLRAIMKSLQSKGMMVGY